MDGMAQNEIENKIDYSQNKQKTSSSEKGKGKSTKEFMGISNRIRYKLVKNKKSRRE